MLGLGLFLASCSATSPAPRPAPPSAPVAAAPAPAPTLLTDWRDAVLYFAILDRFADGDPSNDADVDVTKKGSFHGGDAKGLVAHLDEIASLGANALWVTPVVRNIPGFVTGAGFPDWAYHGYWADDFLSLDPRFGSEDDFRALVAACHARGIRVLLDVVYNHAGYESKYTKDPKTKGWFRTNEKGDCGTDDVTSCVAGLPDFKTEDPEVAKYLLDAQIGWAKRLGVDGFRLDTVKHVAHDFWTEHRKRTRDEVGRGFFLLGEVWGGDPQVLDPWFERDEMDAGFDFAFQGNALAFVEGRGRTLAFDRYLKSREKVRSGYLLAHFLSSHDVPGGLFQLGGNVELFRLAAVLQMTTAGIPTIYYGEEVARPGGDWPENRSDMPWGANDVKPGKGLPRNEALRSDYVKLVAIRKAQPALRRGTHEGLVTQGDGYVFLRRDAGSKSAVAVAVNRGGEPVPVSFPAPQEWGGAAPKDLFGGLAVALDGGNVTFTLPPRSAAILAPGT
ncbi:MAG: alpha-amylase family glycosyl hydrolase [Thermoanaerobaculia bacterium]